VKLFDYTVTPGTLLSPDIVALLTGIHEHKGKQGLFIRGEGLIPRGSAAVIKVLNPSQIPYENNHTPAALRRGWLIEAHADALTTLLEIAKIQSTGASNRIEGINTTDRKMQE
jgi:hypothetical protein